jgi:hypothetical protein
MLFNIEYLNKPQCPNITRILYRRHPKVAIARLHIDFAGRTQYYTHGSGPGEKVHVLMFGTDEANVTLHMQSEVGDIQRPDFFVKMHSDAAEVILTRRLFLFPRTGRVGYWDYDWSIDLP